MSLKLVTGGTTGAADGTLVAGGNPIVFTALDTPVDAHIRMDDDTYAAPAQFVAATTAGPAVGKGDIQLSVDGGSTWKSWSDNPWSIATGVGAGPDLGDLNFPIKLRQHAASPPGDTSGSFDTDGTFTAATALADVTGFTVTPGDHQNAVSWGAVTNRTRYQVDRATNSGFTTGVTLGVYTGTGTSFTDTGLTGSTTYYYRIKAVGTVRYKDSANFATGNGAPFATPSLTDYSTGITASSFPLGICYGPDGNVWFTEYSSHKVAKITPGGTVTEYAFSGSANPRGICVGPDGNLWVALYGTHKIAKVTTGGTITEYAATASCGPWGICSDGTALWFTQLATSKVGKCSTSGTITDSTNSAGSSSGAGICYGPDSNIWYVNQTGNKLCKIGTIAGAITEYSIPTAASTPEMICSGPDGNLWFCCLASNKICKATTGGTITEYSTANGPFGIVSGPDGKLWFTKYATGKLCSITTGGTVGSDVSVSSDAYGVASDGTNLWVCESTAAKIGKYGPLV